MNRDKPSPGGLSPSSTILRLYMSLSEQAIFEQIKTSCSSEGTFLYAGKLLDRAYRLYPDNLALITPQRTLTYKQLYFRALLMSRKLIDLGVGKHDRVMLFYENSIEFYVAYFGIWQTGAVCVPTNTFLHERELEFVVNDAQPKVIIASATLKDQVVNLNISVPMLSQEDFDWTTPDSETVSAEVLGVTLQELGTDDLCALLYTSGTTGTPKGVMLSSKNIMANMVQCFTRFRAQKLDQHERFFGVLPLFHVFAQNVCLLLPAFIGCSVILVQKIDRKLILEGLRLKPTVFLGVPPLFGLLCLMRNAPLDSVKFFISGADMLPDKIRAAFSIIYGRKICAGYGLSEAAPVVAVDLENKAQATYVVGKPLAGVTCSIRDDNGNQLPSGSIGNLWVKGDNVMLGYYNAPDATAQVLRDGWLVTGDLGSIDMQGNLAIRGRTKDIIIHKGFNIYPAEIENVLMMHPTVFKAAVIGQEEDMSGQVPVAFVAVKQHDPQLEASLRKLCSNNLATYKVPRKIICLDDLPMNATGKIDKKQLNKTTMP